MNAFSTKWLSAASTTRLEAGRPCVQLAIVGSSASGARAGAGFGAGARAMGAAPTTGLDDARTAVARGGEAARSALATGRAGAEGEELGAWPARGLEGGDVQAGELALGGRIPKGWEGGRSRRCARAEGPRADDNGCVARELPPAADGTRVAEPGGGGGRRGGGGGAGRRGIAGERDDATAEEEDEVEAACWEAGRPERAVEGEVSPLLVWSSPAERTHSSSAGRRHSARPSMPSCSCWAGARVSSYNHAAPKVEERKEGSGRRTCCCSTPFWTAATHMSSTGRQCLRRPASSSARQLKKMRKGKRGGGRPAGERSTGACCMQVVRRIGGARRRRPTFRQAATDLFSRTARYTTSGARSRAVGVRADGGGGEGTGGV